MTKKSTVKIQDDLLEIGKSIGFRTEKEYSFERKFGYNPRYDVVWFLDVKQLNIGDLVGVELVENKWLPFATFEVEGSTTSSKNQVGNVGNLFVSPCQFHFMIVANSEAAKENDTYRRGVKIVRTMQELLGNKQIIFLDATMLPKKIKSLTNIKSTFASTPTKKGSGGETLSVDIRTNVIKKLSKTNLTLTSDRVPDYFKMQFQSKKGSFSPKTFLEDPSKKKRTAITNLSQYYYCPRIDISAGFYLEGGFIEFLSEIALNLKEDTKLYPLLFHLIQPKVPRRIYYPLLGIEIESGESKHAIGGLVNAGRLHQIGWIVGNQALENVIELYQHHLGMRNTFFLNAKQLAK